MSVAFRPEDHICGVCREVYVEPTSLPCGHTFDFTCIHEWVKDNARCPVCVRPLGVREVVQLRIDGGRAQMVRRGLGDVEFARLREVLSNHLADRHLGSSSSCTSKIIVGIGVALMVSLVLAPRIGAIYYSFFASQTSSSFQEALAKTGACQALGYGIGKLLDQVDVGGDVRFHVGLNLLQALGLLSALVYYDGALHTSSDYLLAASLFAFLVYDSKRHLN